MSFEGAPRGQGARAPSNVFQAIHYQQTSSSIFHHPSPPPNQKVIDCEKIIISFHLMSFLDHFLSEKAAEKKKEPPLFWQKITI
jgi:hypothetical protein